MARHPVYIADTNWLQREVAGGDRRAHVDTAGRWLGQGCRPVQIKRLSEQRIYNFRATKRQQFCPEHLPPDGAGPSTTIALVRKLRKALTDEEVAPVQGQLLLRVASKEAQRTLIIPTHKGARSVMKTHSTSSDARYRSIIPFAEKMLQETVQLMKISKTVWLNDVSTSATSNEPSQSVQKAVGHQIRERFQMNDSNDHAFVPNKIDPNIPQSPAGFTVITGMGCCNGRHSSMHSTRANNTLDGAGATKNTKHIASVNSSTICPVDVLLELVGDFTLRRKCWQNAVTRINSAK
ncbi:hypothetical protein T4E_1608 [Trichinella pseudospiralis]|uniref:Uncharacterized protein n=1 Tax=Trichinella pseudospiralis TaxID=6337 RepID=A0A0V0XPY4_TRIPS|nr:hypothetical protein T4E_1608 [Trichinella pseudospiralis]